MFKVFKGSFDNPDSVASALQGCYGAWINTDGFTIGQQREIYSGIRIFEIAKHTSSLRHYVWSSLDYTLKACLVVMGLTSFVAHL
jgi:NmrA-like family